ncbi:MAG: hypothetical protein QOF56_2321 [Acidobacteriaceae bacterium]|jgi:hypothetical protein|nr:hypothetical protein [Acidobacteriaceae bacterium]
MSAYWSKADLKSKRVHFRVGPISDIEPHWLVMSFARVFGVTHRRRISRRIDSLQTVGGRV